jgi:ABC-type taurine transport system substrate-binding protein
MDYKALYEQQLQENKKINEELQELRQFKKAAEETCEASAVMDHITDRLCKSSKTIENLWKINDQLKKDLERRLSGEEYLDRKVGAIVEFKKRKQDLMAKYNLTEDDWVMDWNGCGEHITIDGVVEEVPAMVNILMREDDHVQLIEELGQYLSRIDQNAVNVYNDLLKAYQEFGDPALKDLEAVTLE